MNNTTKIGIAILVMLLIGVIVLDSTKQKPIDWRPSYSVRDKIPLGLYVFNKEIRGLFHSQNVQKLHITPYEYFDSQYNYDTIVNNYMVRGTYLSITEYSDIDAESIKEICSFVGRGNAAFISSKEIPKELLDTLNVDMDANYRYSGNSSYWFANPKLGKTKYDLRENTGNNYFSRIDPKKATVLGYQKGDSLRANFIKVKFQDGEFFLHTQPAAFTNFHLLKGNHYQYAEKVLSYVPRKGDVFWFIKDQDESSMSDSPLGYIFSQPALKWAWYFFLIGMLVFMIFNAKRKQRVVPIITPLNNTTIDFTKSIGNLYYQEGDHDNIINKKIIYFLERIRNEYLMDTNKLDDDFVNKLHHKSGKNLVDINKAVFLINMYRKSPHNSIEDDLIQINNAIEKIIN